MKKILLGILILIGLLSAKSVESAAFPPAVGGTGNTEYTIGDILYASASKVLSKLGIGAEGTCLKVSSGVPAWLTCGGGGGSGGGTWSTTTSQTTGILINYPNNTTDVVTIGSTATSTAEFMYDPTLRVLKLGNTIAPQLDAFGSKYYELQILENTNDLVGPMIYNSSTGISAATGITFVGDKAPLGGIGANQTNYGGIICPNSGWTGSLFLYDAIKPNDCGFYTTDGNLVLGAASTSASFPSRVGNIVFNTGAGSFVDELPDAIFTYDGKFGVGTTSPYEKLSIVGNAVANSYLATSTSAFQGNVSDTATVPGFTWRGDLNTGMFRGSEDNIAWSTGGTSRMNIDSTDLVITVPSRGPAGSATAPTFSASGDTNTGMYLPGSDILRFSTNSSDRLSILASGFVGIGTSTPGTTLGVSGDSVLAGVVTGQRYIATSTTASSTFQGVTANLLEVTSSTASSTFANGINLTGGCFAINGICVTGLGGGSGTVTSVGLSSPNSTLTLGGTNPVTTSGTINVDLNTGISNWWTARQNFTNATTSTFGATSTVYLTGVGSAGELAVDGNGKVYSGATSTLSTISGSLNLASQVTGTLPIANGGTGRATFTNSQLVYGNGTGSLGTIATTSATCSGTTFCNSFTVIGSSPVTINTSFPTSTNPLMATMFVATSTTASSTFAGYIDGLRGTFGSLRVTNLVSCDTIDSDQYGNMSCGSDSTGAGGSVTGNGIAGMMAAWSSASNLVGTSTIIGERFVATSTTAASSTLPKLETTNLSVTGSFEMGVPRYNWLSNMLLSVDSTGLTEATSTPTAGSFHATSTTASSTLQGLTANLLNVRSTTASSTFANGINLTAGCFAINGACVTGGGGAGTVTTITAGSRITLSSGATCTTTCTISANNQFSYTPSTFGSTASNATSTLIGFTNGLYTTASSTFTATTTFSNTTVHTLENLVSTSTTHNVDWGKGNKQTVRIGTSAISIGFQNATLGDTVSLLVCNSSSGTAGTITWTSDISWPGGVQPGQTTTVDQCDMWSFNYISGTSKAK
jgi:hypothetical protein